MRNALLAVAIGLSSVAATAQQPTFTDSLLDRFVGEWVMKGTIAGQQTTHDVSVEWVLEHQYLRIHEASRELNTQGLPQYEATVYVGWNAAQAEYGCVWLDTYGGLLQQSVGHAKRSGTEIPFVFQEPDGSTFHTTFVAGTTLDSWSWRMDAEAKGKSTPFARVTLQRKPRPVPTR